MTAKLLVPNLDDLIQQYRAGTSMKQLADGAGISRPKLVREFRARGEPLRGRSAAESLKWQTLRQDRAAVVRQTRRAWEAVRGRIVPFEELCRRARTREERQIHRFLYEREVEAELVTRGVRCTPQKAVGPYNLDLALDEPRIAVEIIGCQMVSKRRAAYPKRLEYICNAGWLLVLVVIKGANRLGADYARIAKQIIVYAELSSRNPALRGKYGVIGRNGEPMTPRCDYVPGRTLVLAPDPADEAP